MAPRHATTICPIDDQIAAVDAWRTALHAAHQLSTRPAIPYEVVRDLARLDSAIETLRWVKAFGLALPVPSTEFS